MASGKGWHRGKGSDDHGDETETHGPPIDVQTGMVMEPHVALCLTPRHRVQYICDSNGACCWKHTKKNKSTQYTCSMCSCVGVVTANRKLCKLCYIAESQKQNWSEPQMAPAKHAAQVPGARRTSACKFVVCWRLGSVELRFCPRHNFWQSHIDPHYYLGLAGLNVTEAQAALTSTNGQVDSIVTMLQTIADRQDQATHTDICR